MRAVLCSGLGLLIVVIVFIGGGVVAIVESIVGSNSTSMSNCVVAGVPAVNGAYQPEQMVNAATIVAVGKQMQVPERGWVVAIAAAMQESGLHNLHGGDRDSLGLFQQRPTQGWGSPEQITDPTYAATQFYRSLLQVPGWQQMSVNDAAQAVQRSGFPSAYAQHEGAAVALVIGVSGATCTNSGATNGGGDCDHVQAPNAAAVAAVNYACGQRGLPYVWAGNGAQDSGFDGSGLTKTAYAAATITLPHTAQAQYNAGRRLPDGVPLQPGDLVYYGTPSDVHHVALYIGNGQTITAPTHGYSVQIGQSRWVGDNYVGATRPSARPLL